MRRTIRLFMWGYQDTFRIVFENWAKRVLKQLGRTIEVEAALIGVKLLEVEDRHNICLEPENEEWSVSTFSSCFARTYQIYKEHPNHNLIYGDEASMRDKPGNIVKDSVRSSIIEALNKYDEENATASYCGKAATINEYNVTPVLRFRLMDIENLLSGDEVIAHGDYTAEVSFLKVVIRHILDKATHSLEAKEPGKSLINIFPDEVAMLREAASCYCYVMQLASKTYMPSDMFNTLNTLSSMRYEGSAASGTIVFTYQDDMAVDLTLSFLNPISLTEVGLTRKIIEMSSRELICISQGEVGIAGLGMCKSTENKRFRVMFTGHYRWELYYGDDHIITSLYGAPSLPTESLSQTSFRSNAKRLLPSLGNGNAQKIWDCILAALEQRHGTMLVITDNAENEAKRLSRQSIRVKPVELTPDVVRRVSGIDGAILVDISCACHAIGVILDGLACTGGDPSRGARYNSAIRYVNSAHFPVLCIVVSEDGNVNMLPTLRKQVSRKELEEHITELCSQTHDNYHKTINWIEDHRFYFTKAQCELINTQLDRIAKEPYDDGYIRIMHNRFEPHPQMDSSYYFESDSEQ